MKYLTILLVYISFSTFGQKIQTEKIRSTVLDQERMLWIYTPWQYQEYPDKNLEIIYVFDAQSREYFDLVHSTLQFFGGIEFSFIVVGIESPFIEELNQSRNTDFLPQATDPETIRKHGRYSGGADKFLRFVKTEVIPFMDKNYRTLPERIAVGHSNGGTFISYSLLHEPDLFDAYIAISPNYTYNKEQLATQLAELHPDHLKKEKFMFISHSNETAEQGWGEYLESIKKIIELLKRPKFQSKIHLETKDFSATENHGTTFPVGAFYGLKSFIEYQFRTGENVIAYYDRMAEQNLLELNPEIVNTLAYECFWNGKPEEALKVIHWAIGKFPNAHNLYDSQGEFHEKIGELDKAKTSFMKAVEVLSKYKGEIDQEDYAEKLEYYQSNVQRVSK
ncbi:MAG: alpha/beta hydrolase-fold protein [Cyclobacteriaceae bacterium]